MAATLPTSEGVAVTGNERRYPMISRTDGLREHTGHCPARLIKVPACAAVLVEGFGFSLSLVGHRGLDGSVFLCTQGLQYEDQFRAMGSIDQLITAIFFWILGRLG